MKTLIKNILDSFGYEIKRKNLRDQFRIRQKFEESLHHLKEIGFYPELVIDVGAADGTPPLQEAFPESFFFWIEPLIEFEPELRKLKKKFKGDYVIAGVGEEEGIFTLNVHEDLHGSTMYNEETGTHLDGQARELQLLTLDKLGNIHSWNRFKKILLKVDVQGFELEVLKGAKKMLHDTDVIILEVSLFKFLKNAPDFYAVVSFMKHIGYVVYDIVGGINRPLDLALGQTDIVFVKEDGLFRTSHHWIK
jgi:FkbM family methyltransferase